MSSYRVLPREIYPQGALRELDREKYEQQVQTFWNQYYTHKDELASVQHTLSLPQEQFSKMANEAFTQRLLENYTPDEIAGLDQRKLATDASWFETDFLNKYKAREQALRQGLEEGEAAMGLPPPHIAEQYGQQPSPNLIGEKFKPGVFGTILTGLGAPARAVSGAIAGAVEAGQEAGLHGQSLPMQTQETKIGGVDPYLFFEKLGTEELPLSTVLDKMLTNAAGAAFSRSPLTKHDLTAVLQAGVRQYQRKADLETAKLAQAGKISTDPQALVTQSQTVMRQMLERDPAARNPEISQLLTEMVLDPLWVATPEKVAKVIKALPGGHTTLMKMKGVGLKATRAFRYLPEYDAFRVSKEPEARKILDALEQSETVSHAQRAEIASLKEDYNLLSKLSDEEDQLLYDVIHGVEPSEALPEKLVPAYEANIRMNETMGRIHEHTGLLQTIDPETKKVKAAELMAAEERVPFRVRLEKDELKPETLGEVTPPGRGMKVGAAHERVEDEASKWVPSLKAQWGEELKETNTKKLQAAIEVREINKALKETVDVAIEIESPKSIAKGLPPAEKAHVSQLQEKVIANELKLLKNKTGVDWGFVESDKNLGEIYTRITGTPLETELGRNYHLLPKPVIARLKEIMPIVAQTSGGAKHYLDGIGDVLDKSLRPLNAIFRRQVTSFFPGYTIRNLIGAVHLNTVALGHKMFNPKLQATTGVLTAMAGGLGSNKALKLKYTLKSGEKVTLGDLFEMAKSDGVIDQFDFLIKSETLPEQALDKALKLHLPGLGESAKAKLQTLSPHNINKMVESYQHLTTYLAFLNGTSKADRGKALRLMSDFSGNYQRMSKLDKRVLSEIVPFWGWSRFIAPWVFRRMADRPKALSAWKQLYDHNERKWSQLFPVDKESQEYQEMYHREVPEHLRGLGWTLPSSLQSREHQKLLKDGKYPAPGSAEYFMAIFENPLTMGLSPLKMVEDFFGTPGAPQTRQRMAIHLGPIARTFIQMLSHKDLVTGEDIGDIIPDLGMDKDFEQNWREFQASQVGAFHRAYTDRARNTWNNLAKLTALEAKDPMSLVNLEMRYAIRNSIMGLESFGRQLAGKEKGADISSWYPSIMAPSYLKVDPFKIRGRRAEEAAKRMNDEIYSIIGTEHFRALPLEMVFPTKEHKR